MPTPGEHKGETNPDPVETEANLQSHAEEGGKSIAADPGFEAESLHCTGVANETGQSYRNEEHQGRESKGDTDVDTEKQSRETKGDSDVDTEIELGLNMPLLEPGNEKLATASTQTQTANSEESERDLDGDKDVDTDNESGLSMPLLTPGGEKRRCCCHCAECCWQWWLSSCCGGSRERSDSLTSPSHSANASGGSTAWSLWRAVGLVFAWYFFSMSLSLYNKFLIGEKHGHFPAPLLMTTFHFVLQWAISAFLLNFVCTSWAPTVRLSCRDYNLRIVPTAMATALDIGLSNLSLAFITLTFYTMCKSSAPVFLLLFAFLFRLEALSLRLTGIMLVISIGVLFTVAGETHFQVVGFILVMSSSVTSGLRWVLIQVLLQKDKLGLTNPLVTLSYLTPVMALLCLVFSLLHEPWNVLHKTRFFDTWEHSMHSILVMVLGGFLAFFMILAEFLLVLETSAVTFSVAGTVKEGATILVSHLVFGDKFTKVNLIGIFVILLGVSLFNMYRHNKGHAPKDVRQVSTDPSSEDKQQLLPGTVQSSSEPSPKAPGGVGTAADHFDTAEVIIATSMEPQQQLLSPQQRILSPLAGQGPTSPSARSLELSSRPVPNSVSERWLERPPDGHGE